MSECQSLHHLWKIQNKLGGGKEDVIQEMLVSNNITKYVIRFKEDIEQK